MKKVLLISLLGAAFLWSSCTNENNLPSQTPKSVVVLDAGHVHTGMLVVKSNEEIAQTKAICDKFENLEIYSISKYFKENPRFPKRYKESGLDKWYMVTFNPEVHVTKAHSDLSKFDGFEKVEYVPVVTPTNIESTPFNDPDFSKQWHYHNTAQKSGWVAGMDINLLNAWNIETGSEDVIVAIIDTGVEYDHPDLKDAMWINYAELNGTPGKDDDGNGYIDDIYGYNFTVVEGTDNMFGVISGGDHGTHVAGVIGAVNNNGLFGSGIAGGNGVKKGVRLMSCQTMPGSAYIGLAFQYAADMGAVISQNSWSIPSDSEHIKTAIDYFITHAGKDDDGVQVGPMAGGLVVFAAANENTSITYPAMYDKVVAVSSIGPSGAKASYSNYGEWVDIAAPGGENQGPQPIGQIFSTVTGGGFAQMSGTSMACPHVSGVAALIVSKFGGPGFTSDMLKDRLLETANADKLYNVEANKLYQIGETKYEWQLGVGLVDAFAALQDSEEDTPEAVTQISTSHKSNFITVKWKASTKDNKPAYGYSLMYSKSPFTQTDVDNKKEGISSIFVGGATYNKEYNISYQIAGLDFNTTYYIALGALSSTGASSGISDVLSETTGANTNPIITLEDVKPFTLKAFEKRVINYTASDPDGHTFEVKSESTCKGVSLNIEEANVTINALNNDPGKYTLKLVAIDEFGASSSESVDFEVLPNNPPVAVKESENHVISKGAELSLDLTEYLIDKDGEPLTYEISSSSKSEIVKFAVSEDLLTIKGHWYGETTLTIKAQDAKGASATFTLNILVRDSSKDVQGVLTVDVYPNPVITTLKVRTIEDVSANVKVTNSQGGVVYQKYGTTISPFAPLEIKEAEKWSSGNYTIEISAEGQVVKKNIVKL